MSKEKLNCEDICPNYYSSWEEGTCMECCEIYNRGECPVVYVNDLEKQVADLQSQLAEKDEEIESWKQNTQIEEYNKLLAEKQGINLAIEQLEKVNGVLTDTIIEVTQNEMDCDKLCYLEEISAKFYEKIQQQINELKGNVEDVKD